MSIPMKFGDLDLAEGTSWTDEIIKQLECPICFEAMIGVEIFPCEKGHHLCETCKSKVETCPTCQSVVTNLRGFGMESMADTLRFNCTNFNFQVKLKRSEMKGHLEVCEYRPFQCFENEINKCQGTLVHISDFETHLNEQHKVLEYHKSPITLTYTFIESYFDSNCRLNSSCIKYDGRIFLCNLEMRDNNLFIWFTMIGTETEANRYSYKIKISHPEITRRTMEWNLLMHSHHCNKLTDAEATGDFMCLSIKQLEKFSSLNLENGKFKFSRYHEISKAA